MKTKKNWNMALGIGIALVVLGILRSWLLAPHTNTHPSEKIVVTGTFPYDAGLELHFNANFRSRNDLCAYTEKAFMLFPVAKVDQSRYYDIPVRRIENNKYEAEIFLDLVAPSLCDWTYSGVGFRISGDKFKGDLHHGLGGVPEKIKNATLDCSHVKSNFQGNDTYFCERKVGQASGARVAPAEVNFHWKGPAE